MREKTRLAFSVALAFGTLGVVDRRLTGLDGLVGFWAAAGRNHFLVGLTSVAVGLVGMILVLSVVVLAVVVVVLVELVVVSKGARVISSTALILTLNAMPVWFLQ